MSKIALNDLIIHNQRRVLSLYPISIPYVLRRRRYSPFRFSIASRSRRASSLLYYH
jgi:hypothetical protein